MALTIREALAQNKEGYYIGCRLILPFKCNLLKIIVEGHIFTEMVGSHHIKVQQDELNTSVYLRDTGKLSNYVDTYNVVKIIAAEMGTDLTDQKQHIKLVCEIGDHNNLLIHEPDDNMLFV